MYNWIVCETKGFYHHVSDIYETKMNIKPICIVLSLGDIM